jgi:radical SAM superfamily enzyme YgiQ (UPF0313 family)
MRSSPGARVYLVQICNVFGDSVYLPLAAGMLQSYAKAEPELAAHYQFQPLINQRFDLRAAASVFSEPAVVGLSTYVWNWEFSLALAQRLRELFPSVVIVAGGPQIPEDCAGLVASGAIDVAVHGEGEAAFGELLAALCDGRPLETLAGVTTRSAKGVVRTAPRARLEQLDVLPSPFLSGEFDPLLAGPKQLIGLWETNRGCPFGCTFCYWGSAVNSRVREFSWDRLMREIDWFREHRIDYVLSADANFGIKKRDLEIARKVAAAKKSSGFPRKFRVFSTKNASHRVLDVVDLLRSEGLDQGMSLTMQSLSPVTAEAIGRKNIKLETYVELRREAGKRGMTTYCDLIVGLPGETYDSFLDGLDRLMRLGQHDNVHVYTCTLLVGSEMARPEYRAQHGIVTVRSPIIERHMRADAIKQTEIVEWEEVVIGTATMPVESWIETNLATVLVNVLHYQKLFHWIPIWLHHAHGLGYRRFYEQVKSAGGDARFPRLRALAGFTVDYYRSIVRGAQQRLEFREFGNVVWPIEEAVYLLASKDFDGLHQELAQLVQELVAAEGIELDQRAFQDLLIYQLAQVPRPDGPRWSEIALEHDFPAYFADLLAGRPARLRRSPTRLAVIDQHQTAGDLARYALKVAWYARSATDIPYRLERRAVQSAEALG